ncbi:penicillin-binding protein 1A [Myxococcota bacterium]
MNDPDPRGDPDQDSESDVSNGPAEPLLGDSDPPEQQPRFWRQLVKFAKYASLALAVTALGGAVGVILLVRHHEAGLPSVAQLKENYHPPQVTRVLARDGTVLANLFTERRTVIALSEIPAHAKLAFLAAEDAHFYEHEGLNYWGMLRALWVNLRARKTRQGGSTITQQVVKNILLGPERSYQRKLRETLLARRLEQNLTKDEIFSLYLNHIYFGHGCYGVEEAARYYFGKRARQLDLPEAALLAGLVAAPERFSPRHSPKRALERRAYVLNQMLAKRFVTLALHRQSTREPLRLAPAVEGESELAPEVVDYAKRVLRQVAGERAERGGFTVTTSLDPELQTKARKAVRKSLDRYAKRREIQPPFRAQGRSVFGKPSAGSPRPNGIYVGTVETVDDHAGTLDLRIGSDWGRVDLNSEERYNPTRLLPSQFAEKGSLLRVAVLARRKDKSDPLPLRLELGPQSALVAVDVRTREVRAMVGSYEALPGGLDRATHARRQPGSAFKPFVYSYALHSRQFAPSTVLEIPAGSKQDSARRISVRLGVAKSDNAVARAVLERVGAPNVVVWAQALGIESPLGATPSLALGAYEVTPFELTNAYATLASGGEYAAARLVLEIVGPDGREVALPPSPPPRRAMSPEEAYLTTSLLKGVVERGTARAARVLGYPVAGKTGTTNQARDAWFVGYSTELAVGVWVGHDDSEPLGRGEQGSVTALPAWIEFMRAAHGKRQVADFPRPATIQRARVDPSTGLLAYPDQRDSVEEEFLPGSMPTEMAQPDAGDLDSGVEAVELSAEQAAEFDRQGSPLSPKGGVAPPGVAATQSRRAGIAPPPHTGGSSGLPHSAEEPPPF